VASRSPRAMADATQRSAAEAASAVIARGNAADAVVAGVFAAAAAHPGVLLGPVQVLVAGTGAGLKAVDGRTRQPGRGAVRPRGFRPGDPVVPAARVAVPALPAALAVTLATFGSVSLARVLAPAVDLAKRVAPDRAALLRRLAQRGIVFADSKVAGELVNAAGRVAGGLLTLDDLEGVRPVVSPAGVALFGEHRVALVPWGAAAVREIAPPFADARNTHVVVAADSRGLVAVACYEARDDGLPIAELGLVAPFTAEPVLRGVTRVRPGLPRPAAAPVALVEVEKSFCLGVGLGASEAAEVAIGAWLAKEDPLLASLPALGRAVGLVRTAQGVRVLSPA
jgi:hypothetical protein